MVLERIGNCRIVEELASGGMAVVYKAVQESLNRTVAIKALKTSVAVEDEQFAVRFEREALSLAQLAHENIVHVYDFQKDRGALFIVMEYVEGIDLYDLLDRCERLPVDVATLVALQVARGLECAHYRGIIHRDIKPANIMLARSGNVKLMDFGIARDPSFKDLTEHGTGLGTPSYMSPEQVVGDRLDFRSDLFALGVVLYQMLTGRKPFVEDARHTLMQKIRTARQVPVRKLNPEVPRALELIVDRCLRKNPRDRWRTTQDLVLALERFAARRVDMNYHARLVVFLRNEGLMPAEEAEKYLNNAGGPSALTSPRAQGRAAIVRVARAQATILGILALTVGFYHLFGAGGDGVRAAAVPAPPPPVGYVRLVANPWAHVFVDGEHVATTPFAAPLAVPAGRRRIVLKNDYYVDVEREIVVPEGSAERPLVLRIDLEERRP